MGYQINHYLAPTIAMHLHSDLLTASVNAMMLLWFVMITTQYCEVFPFLPFLIVLIC